MKMVLNRFMIILLFLNLGVLFAQEDPIQAPSSEELQLNAYLESFNTVDIGGKVQILDVAANDPIQLVLPLYQRSLGFLVDNAEEISGSTLLQEMVRKTVPRIQESGDTSTNPLLWQLFLAYDDVQLRLIILNSLGPLSANDRVMRANLVSFLQGQLSSRRTGTPMNVQLALGLVEALGKITHPDIQRVLVETVIARVDGNVTRRSFEILRSFEEGLPRAFFDSFRLAQGSTKNDIFQDFVNNQEITTPETVEFSRLVLDNILSTGVQEADLVRLFVDIRQAAVRIIAANNQPEYAPVLIRHFNDIILGFDRRTIERTVLIEAIGALGTTNSPVAARRLTEFLTLINTYTQQDRPYDRQITLTVLENLKTLQNVESYNALFMVTILNYPAPLKEVAREAMALIAR